MTVPLDNTRAIQYSYNIHTCFAMIASKYLHYFTTVTFYRGLYSSLLLDLLQCGIMVEFNNHWMIMNWVVLQKECHLLYSNKLLLDI